MLHAPIFSNLDFQIVENSPISDLASSKPRNAAFSFIAKVNGKYKVFLRRWFWLATCYSLCGSMDQISVLAASGLRARMESLDLLANNMANSSTSGYKGDSE